MILVILHRKYDRTDVHAPFDVFVPLPHVTSIALVNAHEAERVQHNDYEDEGFKRSSLQGEAQLPESTLVREAKQTFGFEVYKIFRSPPLVERGISSGVEASVLIENFFIFFVMVKNACFVNFYLNLFVFT